MGGVNLHLVTCAEKSGSTTLAVGSDRFHTDWLADAGLFLNDAARQLAHDQVTCSPSMRTATSCVNTTS